MHENVCTGRSQTRTAGHLVRFTCQRRGGPGLESPPLEVCLCCVFVLPVRFVFSCVVYFSLSVKRHLHYGSSVE